jgi:tetratricopeptide (TPR) repeat protein
VEIKPGTVKQARLEAGLSLGQVARTDVSRTAIYFVETGKAKPSIETLSLIAERTGKPLEYFLASPGSPRASQAASLANIERLAAALDHPAVIAAAESALATRPDRETTARIRFRLAMAYLHESQIARGRREASLAREYFEDADDLAMAAECLGTEASGAYLQQDPHALALAEAGLALLRSLKPVPRSTEARLLSICGAAHSVNREWERAIKSYEQAVEIGGFVQDLHSLSIMYGNLSLAYQETGRVGEALRYADRALTIYETLDDRLSLARYENNLAMLFFRQGNAGDALRHAGRSLRLYDELGVEVGKAHTFMTVAEIELSRGDCAEAARNARAALEAAERTGEGSNAGEAHAWLAKIAEAAGDPATADRMFARAIEILSEQGPAERITRAHVTYAEILEARGDLHAANAHLKHAIETARPRALAEPRAVSA